MLQYNELSLYKHTCFQCTRKVFLCFQGVEKGGIGNKWVEVINVPGDSREP